MNKNFGCGSSREHAPQGILRWGIKAIVGESFAEIFAGNCAVIGLPAVTASSKDVKELQDYVRANPGADVSVDLQAKVLSFGDKKAPVEIRESARLSTIHSLDPRGLRTHAKYDPPSSRHRPR